MSQHLSKARSLMNGVQFTAPEDRRSLFAEAAAHAQVAQAEILQEILEHVRNRPASVLTTNVTNEKETGPKRTASKASIEDKVSLDAN